MARGFSAFYLEIVKHNVVRNALFGALFGAVIDAMASVIKSGEMRTIFLTLSFQLFAVMITRTKLS